MQAVAPGTLSAKAGIEPGDIILSINGSKIQDILDYHFLTSEPIVAMELERQGKHFFIEIEKDPGAPLGIDFTGDLFDGLYQCKNNCKFCFVHQIPKGMRKSLYIMDDDYRLSFLYGSFITLSNVSREAKERIKQLRLSPLYISVHATLPGVRRYLMDFRKDAIVSNNPLEDINELISSNISLHTQVVCCPGVNDGAVLEKTIQDLAALYPGVEDLEDPAVSCGAAKGGIITLAVVPVGLTKHRKESSNIHSYTKEEAIPVVNMVKKYQRKFLKELGSRFVFLSDEWYRLANVSHPSTSHYEGFSQLDNGVGMLSLWKSRFQSLKRRILPFPIKKARKVTIFTSPLGAPLLKEMAVWLELFKGISVNIIVGKHFFWGDSVTVSGLFTGFDIKENVAGRNLGDLLLLPSVMTKEGADGELFLDDCHISELEKELRVPVKLVPYLNPNALLKTIIK